MLIFTENREGTKRYLQTLLERAISGTDRAEERIAVITGLTSGPLRTEIQRRFNTDPAEEPMRILIATDAAREGLNFQAHCTDLFHFDLPWNPGRIEQRNGRIDRKLQPAPEVRCHYFVLPQRVEDHVLDVLVRKTETIRAELGSLSQVIDEQVQTRLAGGIRHRDAAKLAEEIEHADVDADRKQSVGEELEEARERQHDLERQIDRCRNLLEASRRWVRFEARPFRDALNCSLELLGAEPLREGVDEQGRPVWAFPAARRARGKRSELGGDARHAQGAPQDRPEADRLAARGARAPGRVRGRRRADRGDRASTPGAASRAAAARALSLARVRPPRSLARVPGAGQRLDPARDPARTAVAVRPACRTAARAARPGRRPVGRAGTSATSR